MGKYQISSSTVDFDCSDLRIKLKIRLINNLSKLKFKKKNRFINDLTSDTNLKSDFYFILNDSK